MRTDLKIPLGVIADDTSFTDVPGVLSADKMRPWRGEWQVCGGWEKMVLDPLEGVCRGGHGWTDYLQRQNYAFGTHSNLYVHRGGALYDITPLCQPVVLENPFTTTNGSAVVTVDHPAHGAETGDDVIFDGASAVAGLTLDGTYEITVVDADTYTVTASGTASGDDTGGGDVEAQIQLDLPAGNINGTAGAGYGTGAYGAGLYGSVSAGDYAPRTWSFGSKGQSLYANPRGKGVLHWENNTAEKAQWLDGAPAQVSFLLVTPTGQLMACGCTNEDGEFDPMCVRTSDTVDLTDWTTSTSNNARQFVLEGSGRIIGARVMGDKIAMWTDTALHIGRFLGYPDGWVFDLVAEHRGLIGPNAVVVTDYVARWMAPGRQFYQYVLDGIPTPLASPVQSLLADMPDAQRDKVVASTIADFSEVWWDFPSSGLENDRAVSLSLLSPPDEPAHWSTHDRARTWAMDKDPSRYPLAVDPDGNVFLHEKGRTANGAPIEWSVRTRKMYLEKAKRRWLIKYAWPDFKDQVGPVTMTLYAYDEPQGAVVDTVTITFSPEDTRADFFLDCRLVEIEISGSSSPANCRFGQITIEIDPTGEW